MAFTNPLRLLGVISGMIVWAAWFVVVYALTGVGCDAGWQLREVPGGNLLSALMLASTLLALVLIGGSSWRGYVLWRRGVDGTGASREAGQRQRFMGLVAFVLSAMAAVGTLMIAIPILMLDPCAT
jgi:hypothetical protein